MKVAFFVALAVLATVVSATEVDLTTSDAVVMYGPCDEPKCPALQKSNLPPIPGYKCNCAKPDEVPECNCNAKCPCKNQGCACANAVPVHRLTKIIDPNAKVAPPKHVSKKFYPSTTPPNKVPPPKDGECKPNVASQGPGNCKRGTDISELCKKPESGCKLDSDAADTASKGFLAAKLSDKVDPSDKPENCNKDVTQKDATAYAAGPAGTATAVVTATDKCTGKTRFLPASEVDLNAPQAKAASCPPATEVCAAGLVSCCFPNGVRKCVTTAECPPQNAANGAGASGSAAGAPGAAPTASGSAAAGAPGSGSAAGAAPAVGAASGQLSPGVPPDMLAALVKQAVKEALASSQPPAAAGSASSAPTASGSNSAAAAPGSASGSSASAPAASGSGSAAAAPGSSSAAPAAGSSSGSATAPAGSASAGSSSVNPASSSGSSTAVANNGFVTGTITGQLTGNLNGVLNPSVNGANANIQGTITPTSPQTVALASGSSGSK